MEIPQLFVLFKKKKPASTFPHFLKQGLHLLVLFNVFHCLLVTFKDSDERFYKPPLHIITYERLGTFLPAAPSLSKIYESPVFSCAFKTIMTSNELDLRQRNCMAMSGGRQMKWSVHSFGYCKTYSFSNI